MLPVTAPSVPLDLATVAQALVLALGLGLAVAGIHRYAIRDRMVSATLSMSLVMLSMTAALVMLVIGESLPRAFSLVGALAVVRFRARIDNPLDIAFVFLGMGAGIACGVLAWGSGSLGVLIIGLAVVALGVVPRGIREVHLVRCDVVAHEALEHQVLSLIDRHARHRWLEQARSLRFGESLSLWYRVAIKPESSVEALTRELSAVEGVERVVVLVGEIGTGDV